MSFVLARKKNEILVYRSTLFILDLILRYEWQIDRFISRRKKWSEKTRGRISLVSDTFFFA